MAFFDSNATAPGSAITLRTVASRRIRIGFHQFEKLFGNLQISAQKNLGALDDGVSTQDFLSLYRQLPQGIDGSSQAIVESCQPLDHLRRRRLRPNHFVEFDFAWSRFHLLRNRRLIHVMAW